MAAELNVNVVGTAGHCGRSVGRDQGTTIVVLKLC